MRPERRLMLLARGEAAKLSKSGIDRWQRTSKDVRDAYLKEHPDSEYKNIRVNTLGERVSKDSNNKDVGAKAKQSLNDMGFKKKTNLKDAAGRLDQYLKSGAKEKERFATFGTGIALAVLRKFKPEEKAEVKSEAEAVTGDPRKKPSAILNSRKHKALLAGVIGIGVCAALFGTGLLDPNIVAFVGIKALDIGISTVSKSLDASSIDEFLIASVIGSFVTSKHGEEYGGGVMDRLKRSYGELMGRPVKEEDEKDDDIDTDTDSPDNENDNTGNPANTNDNHDDDNSAGSPKLPEEEKEITIKRPTAQKLKAISDTMEQAGLDVTVDKLQAPPGTLQQSVRLVLEDGSPEAFKKAVGQLELVHPKTLKPIDPKTIGNSVTGYLTQ